MSTPTSVSPPGTGRSDVRAPVPASRAQRSRAGVIGRGLLRGMRPKQWVKSVLVVAAPLAAGTIGQPTVLLGTVVSVVGLTACASAGYLVNDIGDREADRRHPLKRFRPIAAGDVPVPLAWIAAVALIFGALLGGGLLTSWRLTVALAAYTTATLTYSRWLKHMAVVEMLMVALCFLLRPVAGAAGTGTPLSHWFLIVASFGSLYMVAGKRYAESTALGDDAAAHRRILSQYPSAYLRQTRELAATVTLLAYCLWAFERAEHAGSWSVLSIVPITFGLLRYGLLLESGHGGAPEDVVLHDRALLTAGLLWVVLFAAGTIVSG